MITRIAITGPESTGKTTLSKTLAEKFNTVWIPEYVREYFSIFGSDYTYEDLEKIAKGQWALEKQIEKNANQLFFADTEMLVIKIWSECKYEKCSPWILNTLKTYAYDLYLLCYIDLPWEYDPLRENPSKSERLELFKLYVKNLERYNLPYVIINGKNQERNSMAINAVQNFLENKPNR